MIHMNSQAARLVAAAQDRSMTINATTAGRTTEGRTTASTRGRLQGLPIVVKDNIDVAGMPTTAGSPALAGHMPRKSATAVTRLLDAGAIVIGKTNLHEFSLGITTNNGAFGPARNPYDPIAPLLHQRRFPTLVTQVIPQKKLVKSEFFDRFLDTGAMYWGVNLFAHDGHRDLGDLRIWRSRAKQNYDDNEIAMLRMLYPSLVNAFGAERRAHLQPTPISPDAMPIKPLSLDDTFSLDDTLSLDDTFRHRYGLSTREAEVACMTTLGCTDKEIARRTGVAYTTVRTYLANALRKTGLRNRKSLIAAFAHLNTDH